MGGMGLLRKRQDTRANKPSEEAELLIASWDDELNKRDAKQQCVDVQSSEFRCWAQVEVVENVLASARAAVEKGDHRPAFQQLEALSLLMDQEDDWRGVPDTCRSRLLHLLMAAWVTVTRLLASSEELEEIPNWRFVLRRAITSGEQLASTCPGALATPPGAEILQAFVDGTSDDVQEDDQQEAGKPEQQIASELLDFEAQYVAYVSQPGRTARGTLGGDYYDLTNPERLAVHVKGTAAASGDQTGLSTGSGCHPGAQAEESLQDAVDQLDGKRSRPDGDTDLDAERGRLSSLDDVAQRPVLMRVIARLPASHPLRGEVERELGVQVGTDAWSDVLAKAVAAAEAAGHVLPPPADADNTEQPLPLPSLGLESAFTCAAQQRLGDEDGGSGVAVLGDVTRVRADSSAGGAGSLFGSFVLFGHDAGVGDEEDLLGGSTVMDGLRKAAGEQAPKAHQSVEDAAVSFSSAASTRSVVMMPLSGMGTANTAPAMAVLAPLIPSGNQGGEICEDAGIDFLLGDDVQAGAAGCVRAGAGLTGCTSGLWDVSEVSECRANTASVGPAGSLQGASINGDDYGAYGGELDASWLMDSEEGEGAGNAAGGWAQGASLGGGGLLSPSGGPVGSKRTASLLLPRVPSKLSRMT